MSRGVVRRLTREQQVVVELTLDQYDLNEEQVQVVGDIVKGRHFYLSGAAGTGKTTTIKAIVQLLRNLGLVVMCVSPTSAAAKNIDGSQSKTWHGLLGLHGGVNLCELQTVEAWEARLSDTVRQALRAINVLVIDEVSMLSMAAFGATKAAFEAASLPPRLFFGGKQVLLTGDLAQCRPVARRGEDDSLRKHAIEHPSWLEMFHYPPSVDVVANEYFLRRVMRQQDPAFCRFLSQVRVGKLDETSREFVKARLAAKPPPGSEPVTLVSKRAVAEGINKRAVDALILAGAEQHTYQARETMIEDLTDKEKEELRNRSDGWTMQLAVGMRCLLTVNQGELGHNGLRMEVTGFTREAGHNRNQMNSPSECPFLAQPEPTDEEPNVVVFTEDKRRLVLTWYKHSVSRPAPGLPRGVEVAYRYELPLMPAYACTIHRAQGLTFDELRVDLKDIFERGQGYVGLSRVRRPEGLYLDCTGEATALGRYRTAVGYLENHGVLEAIGYEAETELWRLRRERKRALEVDQETAEPIAKHQCLSE